MAATAQPQLTALAIVGRLSEKYPEEFGTRQHSIVQRLLRALRRKAADQLVAQEPLGDATTALARRRARSCQGMAWQGRSMAQGWGDSQPCTDSARIDVSDAQIGTKKRLDFGRRTLAESRWAISHKRKDKCRLIASNPRRQA
jgi:hypothetical protein